MGTGPALSVPGASYRLQLVAGCVVMVAVGEIDLSTAPGFREALTKALTKALGTSSRVVVDLTAVTFLDSTGLAALVAAKNSARELAVGICLAGPRDNVAKVLRISGLDQVFEIHAKRDDAVAATGGH